MQPILLTAIFVNAAVVPCSDCVLHIKHAAERISLGHSSDGNQKAPIKCCGLAFADAVSVLLMMLNCCLFLDHTSTNDAH